MKLRGWNEVDVILFSGDAYIDHPAFGAAVIGRVLEANGYRVAIVPQPDWRGDHRDFTKLGRPRLFFAVTSGSMDSMVNHYTAAKRLRSDDAYTPEGKAGMRPDYCTITYCKILKQLYPDVPIVIGGIEASMRRLTHYDYWSDKLMPSILVDSQADVLVYGMGEKQILAIAECLEARGESLEAIPQIAYLTKNNPTQHYTTLHNTTQHYTILHNTTRHYTFLRSIHQRITPRIGFAMEDQQAELTDAHLPLQLPLRSWSEDG